MNELFNAETLDTQDDGFIIQDGEQQFFTDGTGDPGEDFNPDDDFPEGTIPGESSFTQEMNQPKDPMHITQEPDDPALVASDLLDDSVFKYTGEVLANGLDAGAAALLGMLAHLPNEEFKLSTPDRKKIEKAITFCAKQAKFQVSPWQGLFIVAGSIYGAKIPQVMEGRRQWMAQRALEANTNPQPEPNYEHVSSTEGDPFWSAPNGEQPASHGRADAPADTPAASHQPAATTTEPSAG